MVWMDLSLPDGSTLKLCSFYRPPAAGAKPIDDLGQYMPLQSQDKIKHCVIAGDFNCPGFNWEKSTISPGASEMEVHETLSMFSNDNFLSQVQPRPTRGENCLDLFFITNPSLVKSVSVLPGISDHDLVVVDLDVQPIMAKPTPRKIYKFKSADWQKIKEETGHFSESFLVSCNTNSVEKNWSIFKQHMRLMTSKFVPSKILSSRSNLPWFTARLRKLTKKKQKLYNQAKESS